MNYTAMIVLPTVLIVLSSCSQTSVQRAEHRGGEFHYTTSAGIQGAIDSVLNDTSLSTCIFGVRILSADDGAVLFEKNSKKLFHPASNMKLLTTAAALVTLGTEDTLTTHFYADGTISDGVLRGNVYIKGVGDPLITTAQLDSIAQQLLLRGVRDISGDIVGDVSYFDTLSWGLGWMWDDEPSTDAAFLTPLSVNSNSVEIDVTPGKSVGDTARVEIKPATTYVSIINNAVTSSDTTLPPLDVTRVRGQNTVVVSGRIAPNSEMQDFGVSVRKPELYFLNVFKERLDAHGIATHGTLRLDSANALSSLGDIVHPLDSVLHQVNKPSDNLAAEHLLKTLARARYDVPGSAALGLTVLKEYLASIHIDTTKMILADGSGLSWYNALSPETITEVLIDQYRRSSSFRHFYESLPVAGIDGTLKNRMKGTKAEGNVHAKTGSLTGVSSLSGYVTTRNGNMLVFSILCNHFPEKIMYLRNAQDKIMELLANYQFTK